MKSTYTQHAPSFPARPKYQKEESLPGYIYRYLSENGHFVDLQTERLSMELFGSLKNGSNHDSSLDLILQIYSLLGIGSQVAEAWLAITAAGEKSYRTSHNFVYCPHCLKKNGIHLRIWGLEWAGYCRIHGDRLWRRCWNCNQLLRWSMIRSNWHCQCGGLLTVAEENLSSQLNQSVCLDKQALFQADKKDSNATSRQRIARQIRATILKSGKRYPEAYDKLAGSNFIHRFNTSWEKRIIQDWPFSFQREIFRLARIYWRKSTATLIAITKNCSAYKFMIAIACTNIPRAKPAAQILIDDFLAPVRASKFVIFNPRQKIHQRRERLLKFWPWWLTICPSSDTFQTKPESLVSQDYSNIELVISGVSTLISVAWHNLDSHEFKEVALSMHISDPEITSAGDIFELIDILIRFDTKETLLWATTLNEILRDYLHKSNLPCAG